MNMGRLIYAISTVAASLIAGDASDEGVGLLLVCRSLCVLTEVMIRTS
jgi:hypothetical protein